MTHASRFLTGLRSPGSAQFLDTDQVAAPIAEGMARIPYGCSVGSSTTSASLARSLWTRGRFPWPGAPRSGHDGASTSRSIKGFAARRSIVTMQVAREASTSVTMA